MRVCLVCWNSGFSLCYWCSGNRLCRWLWVVSSIIVWMVDMFGSENVFVLCC